MKKSLVRIAVLVAIASGFGPYPLLADGNQSDNNSDNMSDIAAQASIAAMEMSDEQTSTEGTNKEDENDGSTTPAAIPPTSVTP